MYDDPPAPFKPAREIALVNLNSSVFIRSDYDADLAKELLELGYAYLEKIKRLETEK
jgi:hypothetical protein